MTCESLYLFSYALFENNSLARHLQITFFCPLFVDNNSFALYISFHVQHIGDFCFWQVSMIFMPSARAKKFPLCPDCHLFGYQPNISYHYRRSLNTKFPGEWMWRIFFFILKKHQIFKNMKYDPLTKHVGIVDTWFTSRCRVNRS